MKKVVDNELCVLYNGIKERVLNRFRRRAEMKFKHLRDDCGQPFATVAIDGERYGVAMCGERDQFSRRKGRLIASGRLEKGHCYTPENNRTVVCRGEPMSAMEAVNLYLLRVGV